MTKNEIKSKFKREKMRARAEYRARVRAAEAEYRNSLDKYYSQPGVKRPQNPPKRPILEEIGNAITHGLGALFAIVAFILLIIRADTPTEMIASVIYFFGMFVMFMSSCLYHAFVYGSGVKRLFHRFDYSSIYLLIGATFAPILLCFFGDIFGIVFFAIQWAIIAAGISLVGVFGPTRLSKIHIPLYVILGWSALMLLPKMFLSNLPLTLWILGGGVLYTLGLIPFAMRNRVSHFIWHFFVLGGAVVQWIGIYLYLF